MSASHGSFRARLMRGMAWNLVGVASLQGSTFIGNVLLANLLGRQVFGEFTVVQSTLVSLAAVAQLATAYTATKYVSELRTTAPGRVGRLLGLFGIVSSMMGAVGALLLFLGAEPLALEFLNNAALGRPLAIASVGVFFAGTNSFLTGALGGLEGYAAIGRAGLGCGALYVVACLAGARLGGLEGALLAVVATSAVQCAVLWRLLVAEAGRFGIVIQVPLRIRDITLESGVLLRFWIPAALNGLIGLPAIWFGNAFLARQPGGYEAMALFAAANSFRVMVVFLPHIVNGVSMSFLNSERGLGNVSRFRRMFWFNLGMTAAIVVTGAGSISLLGPWLLGLFGRGFADAYPVLLVLMGAAILEALSSAIFQLIQAHERIWLSFFAVAVPCFGTLAGVAWLLTPRQGPFGLASAYLAAWFVALVADSLIVWKLALRPANPSLTAAIISTP
jgi:O-antigen/teichoic acid export membrane protein